MLSNSRKTGRIPAMNVALKNRVNAYGLRIGDGYFIVRCCSSLKKGLAIARCDDQIL